MQRTNVVVHARLGNVFFVPTAAWFSPVFSCLPGRGRLECCPVLSLTRDPAEFSLARWVVQAALKIQRSTMKCCAFDCRQEGMIKAHDADLRGVCRIGECCHPHPPPGGLSNGRLCWGCPLPLQQHGGKGNYSFTVCMVTLLPNGGHHVNLACAELVCDGRVHTASRTATSFIFLFRCAKVNQGLRPPLL